MLTRINLPRLDQADAARFVRMGSERARDTQVVYRVELRVVFACTCAINVDGWRYCQHPYKVWIEVARIWDCSGYRQADESVFLAPTDTGGSVQFFRNLGDLIQAFDVPVTVYDGDTRREFWE